jgi:CBS domain-containing protein
MDSGSSVGSIMGRHIVSVTSGTKAATALKAMENSNLSLIPVIDEGRLVGIIQDVLADRMKTPIGTVKEIMGRPLFVEKRSSVDQVVKYITRHGISRVPVVESAIGMHCVGIVSASQLLKAKKSMRR